MNYRALVAEFIGTFALVFAGVGSIAADSITGGAVGVVGIALAHGLSLAVFITVFGAVSGGHLNPAVTCGLWSVKKIDTASAMAYIISQCLGGFAATWALMAIIPGDVLTAVKWGTPLVNTAAGVTVFGALLAEIILTFFLVSAVYGTAVDSRAPKVGGLFIGLTITLDILMGGPISGAAMNPARHLGPAVLGCFTDNLWLYWVGPVVGGVLGAQVTRFTLSSNDIQSSK